VQHNLRVLAELAREGCPILCAEPTAALMLRHDALDLLDDPDVRPGKPLNSPLICGICTCKGNCAPISNRSISASAITCHAISRRWDGRPRDQQCFR
jgi:hypothetical protein